MLITCKECGWQVSDKAISCPHCGVQVRTKRTRQPEKATQIKRIQNAALNGFIGEGIEKIK